MQCTRGDGDDDGDDCDDICKLIFYVTFCHLRKKQHPVSLMQEM